MKHMISIAEYTYTKRQLSFGIGVATFIYICIGCVFVFPHTVSAGLNDGLVGHWTFDGKDTTWTSSTTGTTLDKSGNGNTGTLTSMNRATSPVTGKFGQGLDIPSGSNDYINLGSASSLDDIEAQGGGGLTVVAWIKPRSNGTFDNPTIVGKTDGAGAPTTSNGRWRLAMAGNRISFQKSYSTTILSTITNASTQLTYNNQWQQVAVTWDGSASSANVRLYKNGSEAGGYTSQTDGVGSKVSDASVAMNISASSFAVDGTIDDVRIYNRVLTATEIQQLYKQGGAKLGITPTRTASSTGLGSGLVGHWTFDGKDTTWTSATTGTTLDKSGNGNTGTLTNMGQATSTISGKLGQGFRFEGTGGQKVDMGSPTSLDDIENQGGGMTISAWINPRSQGELLEGTIVNKNNIATTGNGAWNLKFAGTRALEFEKSYNTTSLVRRTNSNTISLGQWQHVILTWDGNSNASNARMYINGTEASYQTTTNGSGTKLSDASNSLAINDQVNNREFDGTIDDVRIYNRVLTATEIQQLYKQGGAKLGITPTRTASSTGLGSGLVGHWTFDGKDTTWTSATTGTTLDKSGNGNTGTLQLMSKATSTAAGKIGQGFKFNTIARVETANFAPFGTSATNGYSTFVWFKTNVLEDGYILENGGSGAVSMHVDNDNGGEAYCRIRDSVNGFISTPHLPLTLSKRWRFMGCIYNPTTDTLTLYLDDLTQVVDASGFNNFDNPGQFYIGGRTYGVSGTSGTIDDVRIYNRVLTATEIGQLYKLGQTKTR